MDTDVVVAAMRSPSGASAALLSLLVTGNGVWLLSVAMALEYEAMSMIADNRLVSNASQRRVQTCWIRYWV